MASTGPRIVVLISGEGSNLQAIIDATRARRIAGTVALVVSNRSAARGLDRARAAGIPAKHLGVQPGADRAAYDAALAELLAKHDPDVLVLAGFMRILGAEFVARFGGRTLNIHPSLLPKYAGLDTHRRVLEAGDREHGATVHLLTNDLDMGPRVIQYRLAVRPDDTPESLQQRVHVGEHLILPRAVDWLATGRLKVGAGGIMLDGTALSAPIVVEEENESQ